MDIAKRNVVLILRDGLKASEAYQGMEEMKPFLKEIHDIASDGLGALKECNFERANFICTIVSEMQTTLPYRRKFFSYLEIWRERRRLYPSSAAHRMYLAREERIAFLNALLDIGAIEVADRGFSQLFKHDHDIGILA